MKMKFNKYILLAFIAFDGYISAFGQQLPDSLMQYLEIAAKKYTHV